MAMAIVFRQTRHQSHLGQQIEIPCERGGIAGILHLTEHLVVGKNLTGILGTELTKAFE